MREHTAEPTVSRHLLSVLVVDDNRELAENIAEILDSEDIESEAVNDGISALDRLASRDFDLVLTDIRMPGMNGVQLLRDIHERWPALPVIVMSAYASNTTLEEVEAAGALDIIFKPIDFNYVFGLLHRVAEPEAPVLLVDDDDGLRAVLSECLLDIAGVMPYTARDLASAERLLEVVRFRVAIVDVCLPDGDGVAFGRDLKARYGDELALVYVTAYLAEAHEELMSAVRGGSMKLLEKPFPPSSLLDIITNMLTRNADPTD